MQPSLRISVTSEAESGAEWRLGGVGGRGAGTFM